MLLSWWFFSFLFSHNTPYYIYLATPMHVSVTVWIVSALHIACVLRVPWPNNDVMNHRRGHCFCTVSRRNTANGRWATTRGDKSRSSSNGFDHGSSYPKNVQDYTWKKGKRKTRLRLYYTERFISFSTGSLDENAQGNNMEKKKTIFRHLIGVRTINGKRFDDCNENKVKPLLFSWFSASVRRACKY